VKVTFSPDDTGFVVGAAAAVFAENLGDDRLQWTGAGTGEPVRAAVTRGEACRDV
jgi:hypothetical protein